MKMTIMTEDECIERRVELEIKISPGTRRRCRSIKVGFQSFSKIDLGSGRGWEEDMIFESDSEHRAGNAEGIGLEEGITK